MSSPNCATRTAIGSRADGSWRSDLDRSRPIMSPSFSLPRSQNPGSSPTIAVRLAYSRNFKNVHVHLVGTGESDRIWAIILADMCHDLPALAVDAEEHSELVDGPKTDRHQQQKLICQLSSPDNE